MCCLGLHHIQYLFSCTASVSQVNVLFEDCLIFLKLHFSFSFLVLICLFPFEFDTNCAKSAEWFFELKVCVCAVSVIHSL